MNIKNLCEILELREGEGLRFAGMRKFVEDSLSKLGIDAVYSIDSLKTKIAVIYFKEIEKYDEDIVMDLHRKIWNEGKSPFLMLILPREIRVYNTFVPTPEGKDEFDLSTLIKTLDVYIHADKNIKSIKENLSEFSKNNIDTGDFWKSENLKFENAKKIDICLLDNLKVVRNKLTKLHLSFPIVNKLIIRSIFIAYMQDREILTEDYFKKFEDYRNFAEILKSKEDTYLLFNQIYEDFNGDVFSVKDDELANVELNHLDLIRHFLEGAQFSEKDTSIQTSLFPYYFGIIPIELISSIYEEFLRNDSKKDNNGDHYTPYHLVTLSLDEFYKDKQLLNKKIIDPSCGSGIFLVESYKRLVEEWCYKNEKLPDWKTLGNLLLKHIYGVDISKDAVRVAIFSLYLKMLDFIEPKDVWKRNVKFPNIHNKNIHNSDFFDEKSKIENLYLFSWGEVHGNDSVELIKYLQNNLKIDWLKNADIKKSEDDKIITVTDGENLLTFKINEKENKVILEINSEPQRDYIFKNEGGKLNIYENLKFDYFIGNPPWGSLKKDALPVKFCNQNDYPISDNQIAQAFIWKINKLAKKDSNTCLILPAKSILFNKGENSKEFRKKFFKEHNVSTILNLSSLRHGLFRNAIGPSIITIYSFDAETKNVLYINPKTSFENENSSYIIINSIDMVNLPMKWISKDNIWKIAMWGGAIDVEIIEKIDKFPKLGKILGGKEYLFSLKIEYKKYLRVGEVDEKLRNAFMYGQISLSSNARISKKKGRKIWYINDLMETYRIDIDKQLNIYKKEFSSSFGIQFGKLEKRKKTEPRLKGMELVDPEKIEKFYYDSKYNKEITQSTFERPRDTFNIYLKPHVLIRKNKLNAVFVDHDLAFSSAIMGIHGENQNFLKYITVVINSELIKYYLFLTAATWCVERDYMLFKEMLEIPILIPDNKELLKISLIHDKIQENLQNNKNCEKEIQLLNELLYSIYDITGVERGIIKDTLKFSLSIFENGMDSISYEKTDNPMLRGYVMTILGRINEIISLDKKFMNAEIYFSEGPLEIIIFSIDDKPREIKIIENMALMESKLREISNTISKRYSKSISLKKDLRLYLNDKIIFIKFNEKRFWSFKQAIMESNRLITEIITGCRNE
ncbi:hypothetical protein BEH94_02950 [Candidatus Altiarchaeales archaeon WOR_SM1_SCG]|nr:hypothetical protein BEH94_02950 [Candidatus Altiarchaeales archaeon WOR_SM1_SCG]